MTERKLSGSPERGAAIPNDPQSPQRRQPIVLGPAQLAELDEGTARDLQDSLRSSGTAARLAHAGLRLSTSPVEITRQEVGARAAFRTEGERGLFADVYFFSSWDDLAISRALGMPRIPGSCVGLTQNGAFAVRIIASGRDAEMRISEIASMIAGEE